MAAIIRALILTLMAHPAQLAPVRIILVGDSTDAPGNGWGPGFCADVSAQVTCVNMAKNGRSTTSYRAEGLWKDVMTALQQKSEFSATWVFMLVLPRLILARGPVLRCRGRRVRAVNPARRSVAFR